MIESSGASCIFKESQLQVLLVLGLVFKQLDQCMYASITRKRTGIVTTLPDASSLVTRCIHRKHSAPSSGMRPQGGFFSQGTEVYPPQLCAAIARLVVQAFAHEAWGRVVHAPSVPAPFCGRSAWTATGRPRLGAASDAIWPACKSGGLLDVVAAASDPA